MLATIVEGEADWADILLLVAVVLFAVTTVVHLTARATTSALHTAGLTALALALLVL